MESIVIGGIKLVATETVKELIKSCINSYIRPNFDKNYKNTELENSFNLIEEYIQEYMERSCENAITINTIVFKNQQKSINELYVPLTIKKVDLLHSNYIEEIYIDKYIEGVMSKYKKILLVDNAGMGKSTILKYLYLSIIMEKKGIPVLIELRRLDKNTSIVDYIMNEMNGINKYFSKEHIIQLVEAGHFIFLFDGYDEIMQESKEEITKILQEFIKQCRKNYFIITSRDENELNSFGDFQRFDIKSLSKEESYNLIRKYDDNGELSKELIEKLENREELKIVLEFLKTR